MQPEIEAKFLLHESKDEFRVRLRSAGAKLVQTERSMTRTLFGKEKNTSINCDYIRVRNEGQKITLSAKQHTHDEGQVTDNKELVVDVSDYSTAVQILQTAGLIPTNTQETKRESWVLDGAQIEIDTWPSLEPYVEIEADSEEQLKNVASLLGFPWEQKILTSVEDIFMRKFSLSRDEVRRRLSKCTFAQPPFADLV